MSLALEYPKLFERLEDKDLEFRHLLSVDENYEDYDSEEFEFDFEEYNYLIYISELLQGVLGWKKMEELILRLHQNSAFENFLASEIDLYAVKSSLTQNGLERLVLNQIEEIL